MIHLLKGESMGEPSGPSGDSQPFNDSIGNRETDSVATASIGNNDDEAQIDPRYFAPVPRRLNDRANGIKTSLLFVLLEYCLETGLKSFKFIDDCSTEWRLDKFANASFHSDFQKSVATWRNRIQEDEVLRNRLLRQHNHELERLTYPMPKRSGKRPKRKRGYSDKGSTRPSHQRFRTDAETTVSVFLADLAITEKVVVYGRRPTVTYRKLPYSREIGRLLESGHLKIEGDFVVVSDPEED
jgi:hypothetical protein